MQAQEARLRKLIEGTTQYVVPLFQRPYSWSEKQWKTLWDDVIEQATHDDARPHFLGSIVTAAAKSVPEGVGKYLLIDGQQRLTTMQILLAGLRDSAGANGHDKLSEKVNGKFLLNTYQEEDEQLKVLPTQDDRPAFRSIIRGEKPPASRLADAYRFFQGKLGPFKDDAEWLERLLTAITDRLSLVSITCDEHDNPHLIVESLNAKGEKLTPADLIRNFLLMRVHVNDQNRIFTHHWLPIQQALGDNLTEFVRHYLMKGGKILTAADVYAAGGACDGFVDQLRSELGGNRCPDDAAFTAALTVQPLYATAKKNARLRVILERMEASYGHKEPARLSGAQIEHVMPQTLTPEWELELGPQARENWARLLRTLGNLTLAGYNADMSNRPYVDKRDAFARSHFELNRYFANAETWTAYAIEARGRALSELATKIWHDLVR